MKWLFVAYVLSYNEIPESETRVLAGTDQNSAWEPTNNLTSMDTSGTSLDYIP